MSRRKPKRNTSKNAVPTMSVRKVWCFRLAALIGVPLLFLAVLELGLRLAGFGYSTGFLLKSSNHGEKTFVQNNQFGWRFLVRALPVCRTQLPFLARNRPAQFGFLSSVNPPRMAIRTPASGVALYKQGKLNDALAQFEDVLQRNPSDATARHYVQELQNRNP